MASVVLGVLAFLAVILAVIFAIYLLILSFNRRERAMEIVSGLSDRLEVRIGIIVLVGLLLLFPLEKVRELVWEREINYKAVLDRISQEWGMSQNLFGPILVLPYEHQIISSETITTDDGGSREVEKTQSFTRQALFLPDRLAIDGEVTTEERYRSIYKALVYSGQIELSGYFEPVKLENLAAINEVTNIRWDEAFFVLLLSDVKGITNLAILNLNGGAYDFSSGTRVALNQTGIHAPADLSAFRDQRLEFSTGINLRGTDSLYLGASGKETRLRIKADWPHPSFTGLALPETHEINAEGFEAVWTVPHLARSFPQSWLLHEAEFDLSSPGTSVGFRLLDLHNFYSKLVRAIKYALFFVGLTFALFFCLEMLKKRAIHWFQYVMLGLSLAVFYLLLLSLAELIGFGWAFLAGSASIIALVSLYSAAILGRMTLAILVAVLLSALFIFLYVLLQLEDYALLLGSLMVLASLAAGLYATRNLRQRKAKAA